MNNKPLNLVYVLYARPHIGGSGIMGIEIAKEMGRRGHDVNIVSYPGTYLSEDEKKYMKIFPVSNIHYDSFKVPPSGLVLPSKISQIAELKGVDILHAHYAITHGEAVIDARDIIQKKFNSNKFKNQKSNPSAIITCHGTDISVNGHKKDIGPSLELRLNQADNISFVSNALQDEAKRLFDLDSYGSVIHNFVDCDKFKLNPEIKISKREELGIAQDKILFYHISNFRDVKNTPLTIKALNYLVNVYGRKNAHLLLIGDGPDRMHVQELVSRYNLNSNVTFSESLVEPDKIADYAMAGDVLLLPSKKEAFGLVSLEAMCLKKPVIGSNVGGIPEVISSGKTGFLFESNDFESMATMMMHYTDYPDTINLMGNAGFEVAKSKFDRKVICDSYEELYYETYNKKNFSN